MSEQNRSEDAAVTEIVAALEERQETALDTRITRAHHQFGTYVRDADDATLRAKRLADRYDREAAAEASTYERQNLGIYLKFLDALDYIEEQEAWGDSGGRVYDVQAFDVDAYQTVADGVTVYEEQ